MYFPTLAFNLLNRFLFTFRSIGGRKSNWTIFRERLLDCLPVTLPTIAIRFYMDRTANTLPAALKLAYVSSVNPSTHTGKLKPPWWDQEIEDLRRSSNKLFNRAKAIGDCTLYKTKEGTEIRSKASWWNYCASLESSAKTSRHSSG